MTLTTLQRWLLAVLVVPVICTGCRRRDEASTTTEGTGRSDAATVDDTYDIVASAWAVSNDGVLSLRLLTPKWRTAPGEKVVLFVEVWNNTDEPVTIFCPYGSSEGTWPNIRLTRPDGVQVPGLEPPGRSLGRSQFWVLGPGMKCLDSMELGAVPFRGLDQVGRHTIEFSYVVDQRHISLLERYVEHPGEPDIFNPPYPPAPPEAHDRPARPLQDPANLPPLWTGELHSEPITITRGE